MEQQHEKLSITALCVFAGYLRAMKRNRNYFSDKEISIANHMVDYITQQDESYSSLLRNAFRFIPDAAQTFFFNKAIVPAYDEVFMLRKIMVRHRMLEAIDMGAEQIIILGGGFDPAAWLTSRLHKGVNFFELDRGPTQMIKRQAILNYPAENSMCEFDNPMYQENFQFIGCDFNSCELLNILENHGFCPKKQTFILAEGVTAYLKKEKNILFLQNIGLLMKHDKSELLIGYLEKLLDYSVVAQKAHKDYKEEHSFSLAEAEAMSFIQQFDLQITAKKRPDEMLKEIHNEHYTYYQNGGIRENYFAIKSRMRQCISDSVDIKEVPEMIIPLDTSRKLFAYS